MFPERHLSVLEVSQTVCFKSRSCDLQFGDEKPTPKANLLDGAWYPLNFLILTVGPKP